MPWCWRLVKEGREHEPLSGEGARLFGGRWNEVGVSVIYTSEHRSLAALEVLVHLNGTNPNRRYKLLGYELDETMLNHFSPPELPPDWREEPPPLSTIKWGTRWAREKRSVALVVPSAVLPEESNILINPQHPDAGKIKLESPVDFTFDPRLFG